MKRASRWTWQRYVGTGIVALAIIGHFSRTDSQVSVQPVTTSSIPTTSVQPGRLSYTSDSGNVYQDTYTGGPLNVYGPGNRKLTPPGALTGQTTTLNNGGTLNAGDTSCTVADDSGFPAVPYIVKIDSEYIRVSAKTGTNWSTIVRAYGNAVGETAAAASHTDGSTVTLVNWMPLNIGTSTTNAAYGGINLVPQAVTGHFQWRALVRIQPSTPYTITARFWWTGEHDDNASGAGVGWREEATGKANTVAFLEDTIYWGRLSWHTITKLADGTIASLFLQKSMGFTAQPAGIRIKNDGTNLSVWLATDGVNWKQIHTNVAKNTYFTTAPDQIFFAVVNTSGVAGIGSNQYVAGTLYSWEVE